jgi:hypothetical protein
MSRHEVEARVAMILVSLPLPPLPVRVCRGEDAADSVCSSHDLHAVMMATDMQRAEQGAVTPAQQEAGKLRKCVALNAMQDKIRRLLVDAASVEDDETCERCYGFVCDALRKYWAEYAHSCADVRVCEMRSVVAGDVVHTHMLAYVRANLGAEPGASAVGSYSALFKFWLLTSFVNGE